MAEPGHDVQPRNEEFLSHLIWPMRATPRGIAIGGAWAVVWGNTALQKGGWSWPFGELMISEDRITLGVHRVPVRGPASLRWLLGVEIPIADIRLVERSRAGNTTDRVTFRTSRGRTNGAQFRTWLPRMDTLEDKLRELNIDVEWVESRGSRLRRTVSRLAGRA